MELIIATLPTRFTILKKEYKAYDACIFLQVLFRVEHDSLEYIYTLSCLFQDDKEEVLFVKCNQRPEGMEESAALFLYDLIGARTVFNLFKEEIHDMLEPELQRHEYSYLRFVLLPV